MNEGNVGQSMVCARGMVVRADAPGASEVVKRWPPPLTFSSRQVPSRSPAAAKGVSHPSGECSKRCTP